MAIAAKYRSIGLLAIILFAVIGFFTVRMPWLEYPKLDLVLEGRHGVGWFTSILFFTITLLAGSMFITRSIDRILGAGIFLLSGLLTAVGLDKIIRFFLVMQYDSSDFALFNVASAGMMLRYGVYVLTGAAGLIFILSIPFLFPAVSDDGRPMGVIYRYGSLGLLSLFLLGAFYLSRPITPMTIEGVSESIERDYEEMNDALAKGDLDVVVDYTHPSVYQTLGGKDELKNLIGQVQSQSKKIDSEVTSVVGFEQKGREIQAIFHHTSQFETDQGNESTRGSSFAFSYDGGKTWVFAGINGRSFKEMKQFFPDLFNELDYTVGQN